MRGPERHSLRERLADFENRCREKGLKITHQRLEIYRELLSAADHPSVEAIFQRVRKRVPTISMDTVYRTLAMLEQSGVIHRIQTAEGIARYESDYGLHHHLICNKCHEVVDFNWELFDSMVPPPAVDAWGVTQGKNIVITGICRQCAQRGQK